MTMLDNYESIVGKGVMNELCLLSGRMRNRSAKHIYSTAVG
jgi:hypothetical protein